ncbi:MAG: BrnT family toxin [Acetobacteraceae bacterium]
MSEFEWDERKRERKLAKHGIDFADALGVFAGETLEFDDERKDYGEARTICLSEANGHVFLVVFTWRGQRRRIISVRQANEREREIFRHRCQR